jgi:hypothetical protein
MKYYFTLGIIIFTLTISGCALGGKNITYIQDDANNWKVVNEGEKNKSIRERLKSYKYFYVCNESTLTIEVKEQDTLWIGPVFIPIIPAIYSKDLVHLDLLIEPISREPLIIIEPIITAPSGVMYHYENKSCEEDISKSSMHCQYTYIITKPEDARRLTISMDCEAGNCGVPNLTLNKYSKFFYLPLFPLNWWPIIIPIDD